MTCILTCINSKIIEIIRIKSVFDKNKNHVEKVVDLITTWFFSIYIIVVSFYCTRVGCDGTAIFCGAQGSGFQSTHPRGVRHIRHHTAEVEDIISIHAPAWGATSLRKFFLHRIWISIHAPAWGATVRRSFAALRDRDFNPRTRVGCDTFVTTPQRSRI